MSLPPSLEAETRTPKNSNKLQLFLAPLHDIEVLPWTPSKLDTLVQLPVLTGSPTGLLVQELAQITPHLTCILRLCFSV